MSHSKSNHEHKKSTPRSLADGRFEDVEFSRDQADQEDWEALERSERADARMQHDKLKNHKRL